MTHPLKMPARLVSAFDPGVDKDLVLLHARLRGLRTYCSRVVGDRNARGIPLAYRADAKALVRPHLRQAIGLIREARTALLAGDADRWLQLTAQIAGKLNHAQALIKEPFITKALTLEKQRGHNKGDISPKTALYLDLKQRHPNFGQKTIADYISTNVGKGTDAAVDACFLVDSRRLLIDRSTGREVSVQQIEEQAKAALKRAKVKPEQ